MTPMRADPGCPYGSHRAGGGMPQPALRLDPSPEIWRNELLLDVDYLNLDSSSMRQIAEAAGGSETEIKRHILGIVADRGKMHNPVTGSGGVALGRVRKVGPDHPARHLVPGQLVCTAISLSLTPLALSQVHSVDVRNAQLHVSGTAVMFESAVFAVMPADFDTRTAMAIVDVWGAPTSVRRHLAPGATVAVMGAGKAGLLSAAAAREAVGPGGRVVLFDIDSGALGEAASLGIADDCVRVDLLDPVRSYRLALDQTGGRLFDFVVNATNIGGTEMASILATRDRGRVLFFGMATNFQVAALGAEGAGKDIEMLIGNGYAEGCTTFAFDLVRRHPALWALLDRKFAPTGTDSC